MERGVRGHTTVNQGVLHSVVIAIVHSHHPTPYFAEKNELVTKYKTPGAQKEPPGTVVLVQGGFLR